MSAGPSRQQERKPIGQRVAELEARTRAMDVSILSQTRNAMAVRILAIAVALEAGIEPEALKRRMRELTDTLAPGSRPYEHLADIEKSIDALGGGTDAASKTEAPT